MLTADTDLQFRTDAPTGRYGKSNQLANSIPIKDLEWIVGKYTTIDIVREEAAGVVSAESKGCLR